MGTGGFLRRFFQDFICHFSKAGLNLYGLFKPEHCSGICSGNDYQGKETLPSFLRSENMSFRDKRIFMREQAVY